MMAYCFVTCNNCFGIYSREWSIVQVENRISPNCIEHFVVIELYPRKYLVPFSPCGYHGECVCMTTVWLEFGASVCV